MTAAAEIPAIEGPDPAPHILAYAGLRRDWHAAEAGPLPNVPWADPNVVRLCKRIGAVPKSYAGRTASEAVRRAAREMADATGDRPEDAYAVLLSFATDGFCGERPRCAECPVSEYCAYPDRRPTIKDLPRAQRPRERLIEGGEEQLSDVELLAIIIRDGSGKETALQLAERLLSAHHSFGELAQCTIGELTRVNGIGPAKAAQIKAALAIARRYASERLDPGTVVTGSGQLVRYMQEKLRGVKKELFFTLLLDTKHRIIREEQIAVGSLNETVVHPREVFKSAIRESAAKVLFVHNHPSGNPEPSLQDRRLTARLCQAGDVVGIGVLDHIVVGADGYFSFAEHGLIAADGS